jgi:ABC-type lipoprotein release transport system permease subunit
MRAWVARLTRVCLFRGISPLEVLGSALVVAAGGALVGSRLLAALLFEVSPTDPATLGGVCILLLAVALMAAYVPARRATSVDSVLALRAE